MKRLLQLFILVFITSIKLNAQLSPEVLRGINPLKGVEFNTKLVLQNGFTLNKLLSRDNNKRYEKKAERFEKPEMVWYTSNESVKITETEIEYNTQVEINEIEDYIKELHSRYSSKKWISKIYKNPGKNTLRTYLINNNLMLIISGYPSSGNKTKGTVYYSLSKV